MEKWMDEVEERTEEIEGMKYLTRKVIYDVALRCSS